MSLPAPDHASPLHLIGCFDDPYAGAEREMLDVAQLLAPTKAVQLWSTLPPHPSYVARGVRSVQPFAHQFPKDGTLLVGGVHVKLGVWLKYARLKRIILVYNLISHARLFASMEALRELTPLEPELVFASHALQKSVGLPGQVVYSVMDLSAFLAVNRMREAGLDQAGAARSVTVGRLSRDMPEKHHPDDPALYRMLASRGVRVRIMGGTCLAAQLQGVEGVELLPVGAETVTDFYRSLDIFFYRTGSSVEAYGRVVVEAMASGLPVVADSRGGYAETVKPGVSGYLVRSQEEAWDALMELIRSPQRRRQMGNAGVQEALRVHGPEATQAVLQGYLS